MHPSFIHPCFLSLYAMLFASKVSKTINSIQFWLSMILSSHTRKKDMKSIPGPSCLGVLAGLPCTTIRDLQPGHPDGHNAIWSESGRSLRTPRSYRSMSAGTGFCSRSRMRAPARGERRCCSTGETGEGEQEVAHTGRFENRPFEAVEHVSEHRFP